MIGKLMTTLSLGALAAAAPLGAQSGFGIVGGLVSANVSQSPQAAGVTYNSRTGFAAGISLTAELAKGISIGPEALYAQKGSNLASSVGTLYTGFAKATYVEVPLLLRIGLGSGATHFFVTAGPEVSFNLNCRTAVIGLIPEMDCNDPADPKSGVKSTDYGVMFGAGVAMGRLSISARYDLGLANISRDNTAGAAVVKNKAIFAMIGLSLGK